MTPSKPRNAIPVVIDTDVGADPDDAIALALACASPEIELIGITTVSGDVELRAKMASRLLGMAGHPHVPVAPGIGPPLNAGGPATMMGIEGRGLLDQPWSGPEAIIVDQPAPEWLIETSKQMPFHLVAIGPLTNVAVACHSDPGFASRLLGLTIMGGVYDEDAFPPAWRKDLRERGLAAWPDYNTACDPTAALICAQSGADITWITSEVTHGLPLRQKQRAQLAAAGELGAALTRMIDSWYQGWFRATLVDTDAVPADAVALLHDPLTIASLIPEHEDWLSLRTVRLGYAIEDGLFRLRESVDGKPVRVATHAGPEAFAEFCLERIVCCTPLT